MLDVCTYKISNQVTASNKNLAKHLSVNISLLRQCLISLPTHPWVLNLFFCQILNFTNCVVDTCKFGNNLRLTLLLPWVSPAPFPSPLHSLSMMPANLLLKDHLDPHLEATIEQMTQNFGHPRLCSCL